jgi:hypothetical protein
VRMLITIGLIMAGILLTACGDDEGDGGETATPGGTATAAGGGTEIAITLQEFSVIPEADSAHSPPSPTALSTRRAKALK